MVIVDLLTMEHLESKYERRYLFTMNRCRTRDGPWHCGGILMTGENQSIV